VGTHQNVIHLNGKVYNAKTGEQLHAAPATKAPVAPSPHRKKGVSVDGFISHPKKKTPAKPHTQPAPASHHPATARPVKHVVHRKQQRSQTLMRRAVSKPSMAIAPSPATTQTTEPTAKPPVDARLKRAQAIQKSARISKFSAGAPAQVEKRAEPLSVRPAPAHIASPTTHSAPHHAPPAKTVSKSEAHFNRALSKSTAHTEHKKPLKKQRRMAKRMGISSRALNAAAGALAIVLLAGFFAYQNIPNISMRVAASRAGFSAKMPGYQPSGFALQGPINYKPGQISLSFKSNSDDRAFNVSQQVSGWNSEALADNYLVANNKEYQTYQDK
jgi:hypothetical protein